MKAANESPVGFLGTYFEKDSVLKLVTLMNVMSWIVAVVYGIDLLVAIMVFLLQFLRGYMVGLGFTDYVQNILFLVERPFRGVVYFAVLQAAAKVLLIFLDIEDNTRRTARGVAAKGQ
jgi:hypothetical protein